ncbi:hypothetical protein SmJEL517_g04096 [Synchytrium microbalum]|uniref:Kinesin-like protein n=1 Tax=Synchytrium microbalum TaxID=1806994 RepID=A0A507BTM7_9FUNG|nr:uncharacterized protein SmJEL517_g04096 [Synchytrium microbalum]TPX32890.1 hypothetical protein SmJEL517_g04096 [Synchytrium microbalum]
MLSAQEQTGNSTDVKGEADRQKPPPSASKLKPPTSRINSSLRAPPFNLATPVNNTLSSTSGDLVAGLQDESTKPVVVDKPAANDSDKAGASALPSQIPTKPPPPTTTTTASPEETFKVHTASTSLKRKAPDDVTVSSATSNIAATSSSTRNTRARVEIPAPKKPPTPATSGRMTTTTRSGASSSVGKPTAASKAKRTAAASSSAPREPVNSNASASADNGEVSSELKKKKRPAWDLKGRLQDLEDQHATTEREKDESKKLLTEMTDKLDQSQTKMQELLEFRFTLENKVQVKERENTDMARDISDLKYENQSLKTKHEDELASMKSRYNREMDDMKASLASSQRNLENTQAELTISKQENLQLRATVSSQSAASLSIESDCRMLRLKLETTEESVRIRDSKIGELESQVLEMKTTITKMENKVREEETLRRRLHNMIQELKGNIRVFCRVRPPLESEIVDRKVEELMSHINFPENEEENAIELSQLSENVQGSKPVTKSYPFTFDRVFQPKVSQGEVFDEISQLVQSALDGYPVCIFAYGQTGSGKTFTMEGPDNCLEDEKSMGMIPRAVLQIFECAEKLKEKGWTYTMEAQFLEIYNESIRDLLAPKNDDIKHEIKHDNVTGKTSVTDMTTVVVNTPKAVQSVLKKASQNRAVGATQVNERSSRSHSVFILRLVGHNSATEETSEGVLNLIDLAGSERLSASGSTGDRLKETQAINKSLACLGDVIFALANKDQHIPYRNSKLTYLLQNSLGGNSKTLMFVNVSPLANNFNETLNSLRFATKVNSCQIGTARKQIKAV